MKQLYIDFLSFFERKQKRFLFYLFFLIIIGTFLEVLSIALIVPAINLIIDKNFVSNFPYIFENLNIISNFLYSNNILLHEFEEKGRLVFVSIFFLVLVFILRTIFLIYISNQQAHLSYLVNGHLSKKFFDSYIKLDYPFFLQTHSSTLTHNINNEVGNLTTSLNSFMIVIIETLIALCLVGLLIYFEPKGSIIVISLFFVSSYLFHQLTKKRILKWGISRRLHQQKRLKHTQQGFGNIKNIKIFDVQKKFSEIYSYHNEIYSKMIKKHIFFQSLPRLWLELIVVISLSSLILIILIQERSTTELISILGLYAAASFRLLPSMNRILTNLQNLKSFFPVIRNLKKEMNKINSAKNSKASSTGDHLNLKLSKSINIKNLSFKYENADKKILDNISLDINRGDKLGIKGVTGAGKSTFTNILLGLLEPTNGSIKIDNKNIFEDLKKWRKLIGYVPQDVYLSDDTIKNNICFTNSNELINNNQFRQTIKNAQLEDFILTLKEKEETIIGENGIRLSGGQRQRIGIARALYRMPEILILDEATSALDIETEDNLVETIFNLNSDLTLIVISHRMNTLKNCNKLFEVKNSKINKIN